MKRLALLFLLSLVVPVIAVAADTPQIRDGQWEVTMVMDIPGLPVQMKPMTHAMCVSKEDSADPNKSLPKASNDPDCKATDMKVDGQKYTWKVVCAKSKTTQRGEMTYKGDSYEGVIITDADGQEMTMKMKGKRLGDCPKK